MKYEYTQKAVRIYSEDYPPPGVWFDGSTNNALLRMGAVKLLTEMSEKGWEFCGSIAGNNHEFAERRTPEMYMFRKLVESVAA